MYLSSKINELVDQITEKFSMKTLLGICRTELYGLNAFIMNLKEIYNYKIKNVYIAKLLVHNDVLEKKEYNDKNEALLSISLSIYELQYKQIGVDVFLECNQYFLFRINKISVSTAVETKRDLNVIRMQLERLVHPPNYKWNGRNVYLGFLKDHIIAINKIVQQ